MYFVYSVSSVGMLFICKNYELSMSFCKGITDYKSYFTIGSTLKGGV